MHIQTILNRVQKNKGFVYGDAKIIDTKQGPKLEIQIEAHKSNRGICSKCGGKAPGYDTQKERRFEFIPTWGLLVFFVYAMRRLDCPRCGVTVERVPWAEGKSPICTAYAWFLAGWAKRLAWSPVADAFHTSWYQVAMAVQMAVQWGREHMNLEGITAIGVDEIAWAKGHTYATVVYQINEGHKRLLWVGKKRTAKTFLGFFHWLRNHRGLILNWFRAKKEFSSGVVEGLNCKAKLTTKMAYGYGTFKTLEIALYHRLGALPEPKSTHKFF